MVGVTSKDVDLDLFSKIVGSIKKLSIEAIEKAKSGHPGMPLGCAEIAGYLYTYALRHNPKDPSWVNRDRFVLSAGHGSAMLYACLHLSGFDVPLEEIQNFRQLGSMTPGHPEFGHTPGVEATTGPLGQGIGNAVGMALGMKILQEKFNRPDYTIFNNKIYCLCGDGCMMEGVSHEVCNWAGNLNLDNLVLIYDYNNIVLDGDRSEVCSEDTKKRFEAYGWEVFEIDGYDIPKLHEIISSLKKDQKKPTLIIAHTIIGRGSPKEGTHKAHGAPLGEDGIKKTIETLDLDEEPFFVSQVIRNFFSQKLQDDRKNQDEWIDLVRIWSQHFPDLFEELQLLMNNEMDEEIEQAIQRTEMPDSIAGRIASNKVIQTISSLIPNLLGGSADLSSSDGTCITDSSSLKKGSFLGKNIKYGVSEFGMGTIMNGLAYTGMFKPFGGTFLVFSDYLRNAIRIAALTKLKVIYQFTHDSIFVGEDGPTHQPIEHIMSLRAIPGLQVIRPADANEVKGAWIAALKYQGPTALILSRQNLPSITNQKAKYMNTVGRGAYIVVKEEQDTRIDFTLFATGSEVSLAISVGRELELRGKNVRVVSMPCWEIFEEQDAEYKESIIGGDLGKRVSIEAGSPLGWYKYVGASGCVIAMDSFGYSGSPSAVAEESGFTMESILHQIL